MREEGEEREEAEVCGVGEGLAGGGVGADLEEEREGAVGWGVDAVFEVRGGLGVREFDAVMVPIGRVSLRQSGVKFRLLDWGRTELSN